jgi:hypothetical protein
MAETLRQKQSRFARYVALLIQYAEARGFEVTFGDTYRDPRAPYGNKNSLHHDRLAVDLNLFRDGRFLTSTESHRPLGEFWKSLSDDCTWGGDFKPVPDGNHYGVSHGGRK